MIELGSHLIHCCGLLCYLLSHLGKFTRHLDKFGNEMIGPFGCSSAFVTPLFVLQPWLLHGPPLSGK